MSLTPKAPIQCIFNELLSNRLCYGCYALSCVLVIICLYAEIYYLAVGKNNFNNQIAYSWQQFSQFCNTYKYEILACFGGLIIVGIAAIKFIKQMQLHLTQNNDTPCTSRLPRNETPKHFKLIQILNDISTNTASSFADERTKIETFLLEKYPNNSWKEQCKFYNGSIVNMSMKLFNDLKGFLDFSTEAE